MAKTMTAPSINDQDVAMLMERQTRVEETSKRLEDATAKYKAAKANHEEATEQLSKFLYALHHGLPLFDGEQAGED